MKHIRIVALLVSLCTFLLIATNLDRINSTKFTKTIPSKESETTNTAKKRRMEMKCFQPPTDWIPVNVTLFEDVSTAELRLVPSKSILFHETSCFKNGVFKLNAR